ncbi:S-layer homology domain-containing protein [Paenibacillus sp. YAF4_2]|uniref:S-layer homology domain-containing protein n=1 Tax=Paenibacillus sp. YAF4_2 TaxID=3233085 RepID=UPI003F9B2914
MKTFYRNSLILFLAALFIAFPFQASKVSAASAEDTMNTYFPGDIDEHWAFNELDNFVSADLLKGYVGQDGEVTLKPDLSISRAEFVSILVRALGLTSTAAGKTFADVPADKWYSEPIQIASSLGIVNGLTETTFGPNELIKRGEIATMVVRAFTASVTFEGEAKAFTDVPEYFATPFIKQASQAGIVRGATATTFKPYANATRAEAVVMIQRALDLQSSDLPEDAALTAVIEADETEEVAAINALDFAKLGEVQAKYMTGYSLAFNQYLYEDIESYLDEGYSIKMEKLTPQKLEIVSKSNRFAVVQSTGSTYNVTEVVDGESSTNPSSYDGVYYLKKMPDNSWKIYSFYDDEDLSGEAE